MEKYAVILAGGEGTRLWPLSRRKKPKQFLCLNENSTMLNDTIRRLDGIVHKNNIFIVAGKRHAGIIKETVNGYLPDENILLEPFERNTSACTAYAASFIKSKAGEALMSVLPSDHYIADDEKFRGTLQRAYHISEEAEKIVAIGVKPDYPCTRYGYMQYHSIRGENTKNVYEIEKFIEKPDTQRASELINEGRCFWNSGIYVWKTSVILENFKRYLPEISGRINEDNIAELMKDQGVLLKAVYDKLQSISIDCGIMERSDEILALEGEFGWNDIGTWDTISQVVLADGNGNSVRGAHIGIDSENSIIFCDNSVTVTIGIENLVIASCGGLLLVCPRDRVEEIKKAVDILKQNGLEKYL